MRRREGILQQIASWPADYRTPEGGVMIELLLDIRDMLYRDDMKTTILKTLRDNFLGSVHDYSSYERMMDKINKALEDA